MKHPKFCQSCTLPLNQIADRGTEKDGSPSNIYCKYCYKDGAFTDPDLTMDQMKVIVSTEMHKQKLSDALIRQSIEMLPHLQRWNAVLEETNY